MYKEEIMATAIEYGLVAALIGVGAIIGLRALQPEEKPEEPTLATCSATSINARGTILLSCPTKSKELQLSLTSSTLAIAQAVRPRPMSCSLYKTREADCRLDL